LQRLFDKRHQTVELDRPLQQSPGTRGREKDQDGGDAAEPNQKPVTVMHDMLRRRAPHPLTGQAARARQRLGAGLTRAEGRASVATIAGTAR
jgi:hypothetical protein